MKTIPSVDKRLGHALYLREQIIAYKIKWIQENPFNIECVRFDNDLGIRLILKTFPEQYILDQCGLLFGDCIHNLRSALDNLAYELACLKCNPPNKPNIIYFPILKDISKFDNRVKACLEQLPEDAAKLIEALQPFQRDGSPEKGSPDSDLMGLLHEIDLIDKHRIPSPMLFIPLKHEQLISYDLSENDFALPDNFYVRQEPLQLDCILAEYRFPHRINNIKGSYNFNFEFSLLVNNQRFEIEEIINLLLLYTNQVINLFRDFFTNNQDIDDGNLLAMDVAKDENGFQFKLHEENPRT
jgi:hypothetical protein